LSKNDSSTREIDDNKARLNKLELLNQALTLERDDLLRSKKDREAKIQELTRKYAVEKENAETLRKVY
jgi:hypothetical protein